jgi:hypothetical protein
MSISVTTDVFCDICHDNWISGLTSHTVQSVCARRIARMAGWTRVRVAGRLLDVCPECTARRKQHDRRGRTHHGT